MTQQYAPTKQLKGRLRRKVITDSVCAAMCPLLQQLTILLEGSVDVFIYMCYTKLWVLLVQYPSSIPCGPQLGPGWAKLGPSWAPVGPDWGPFGNAAWVCLPSIIGQFSHLAF